MENSNKRRGIISASGPQNGNCTRTTGVIHSTIRESCLLRGCLYVFLYFYFILSYRLQCFLLFLYHVSFFSKKKSIFSLIIRACETSKEAFAHFAVQNHFLSHFPQLFFWRIFFFFFFFRELTMLLCLVIPSFFFVLESNNFSFKIMAPGKTQNSLMSNF